MEKADLIVLGAGPSGLAAAWRAARSGLRVIVLEETSKIGGLAASVTVGGIRVDLGSHRLSTFTSPKVLNDLRDLLGDDLQVRVRSGRIRLGGRWLTYPLRPWESVRRLPPRLLTGIAGDVVLTPFRRIFQPRVETYASVLRAGLGPTLYAAMYAPFALKLWGLPGERLSGRQARARVVAGSPGKMVSRTFSRRPPGESGLGARSFFYPRRGFGQIPEALAEAAEAAGATLRTESRADRLRISTTAATVTTEDGTEYSATRVFSTLPVPGLVRLVSPGAPARVVEAASRLRFRAMISVHLVHEGGRWTSHDAHYLSGDSTRITRVSEPTNYRDNPDDPTDRTVLCVEVPCTIDDAIWQLTDDEIVTQVVGRLAEVGLPPVRLSGSAVFRVHNVYPVYRAGFEADLEVLDAWVGSLPSLTSFGRVGLFTHDSTHHALEAAYAAADAFAGGRWNAAAWAAARAEFAEHVVDD